MKKLCTLFAATAISLASANAVAGVSVSAWSAGRGSATATLSLDEGSLGAVSFAFATAGRKLGEKAVVAEALSAAAPVTLTAAPLAPGAAYRWEAEIADLDGAAATTLSGEFRAAHDAPVAPHGLVQGRLSGDNNKTGTMSAAADICRTAGPVMAFTAGSATSIDGETTTAWANRVTFLYQGCVYLDAAVEYGFGAAVDDYANLWIDGEPVFVQETAYRFVSAAYTPAYTGWHPIEIRLGNNTGGAGCYSALNNLGFAWNDKGETEEGASSWTKFTDGGTGELFVSPDDGTSPDSLKLESAVRSGASSVVATLSFAAAKPAALAAWCGTELGGADSDRWDKGAVALGDLPGTGADRFTASLEPPEGTKYVRFVATAEDGSRWAAESALLAEIAADAATAPVVDSVAALSAGQASAVLAVNLASAGTGAASAALTLRYGPAAESMPYTAALADAAAPGRVVATVQGLVPGTTYYAVVDAKSAAGESSSALFTFSTGDVSEAVGAGLPGVLQGRFGCTSNKAPDTSVRVADLDGDETDRALSFLMASKEAQADDADSAPTVSDDATRTGWKWSNYTTYLYEGFIWLEKGVPFYASSKFDDGTILFIDGEELYNEYTLFGGKSGYNTSGNRDACGFTPSRTGWHEIRAYVYDWAGGKTIKWGVAATAFVFLGV